jgi:predicted DNA-binding transcriptional regulator AlpA
MIRPYTAPEICEALGITLDTLYRTRERRHDRDGLPRPFQEHPLKWERSGFDAWLTRHHPLRPPRPANDVAVVPDDGSITERARPAVAYAPQRPVPPLDTGRQRARG